MRVLMSPGYRVSPITIAALAALILLFAAWPTPPAAAHFPPDNRPHACSHVARPLVPRAATVKYSRASLHQRRMLTTVLNVGRSYPGARRRPAVMRSAIVAMTQESTATNLGGGDGSSVGLFQIIGSWGSWAQRHNPRWSARWFFSRAVPIARSHPTWGAARLAQAVEQSGYPTAYRQWVHEARRTYRLYRRPCPA